MKTVKTDKTKALKFAAMNDPMALLTLTMISLAPLANWLEAELPQSPESAETLRSINRIPLEIVKLVAQNNAETFMASVPDFPWTEANVLTLITYMRTNDLPPTVKNFKRAYRKLFKSAKVKVSQSLRKTAKRSA